MKPKRRRNKKKKKWLKNGEKKWKNKERKKV